MIPITINNVAADENDDDEVDNSDDYQEQEENEKEEEEKGWLKTVLRHHLTLSCFSHLQVESQTLKLLANTYIGIGISFFILLMAIVHIVWKV